MVTQIVVAEHFTANPFGRRGEWGGETFRQRILEPAFLGEEDVEVVLDGVHGMGPSFLEETFGGLVRAGYSPAQLRERLKIIAVEDPSYVDEAWQYIDDEGRREDKEALAPAGGQAIR